MIVDWVSSVLKTVPTNYEDLTKLTNDTIKEASIHLYEPRTYLIGGFAFITLYVAKFYYNVRKYPPGPTPIPIFGNFLAFKRPGHVHDTIKSFREKYGDVLTLWLGSNANIFVFDYDIAFDAFKSKEFSGRPDFLFKEVFMGTASDVAFQDYGRDWEVLRRVFYAAVRRYAVSDKLATLVSDVVDDALRRVKEKNGEEPFEVEQTCHYIIFNILAQSAYGKRYTLEDPEFQTLTINNKDQAEISTDFFIFEFMPILRYFMPFRYKRNLEVVQSQKGIIQKKFSEHVETFDPNAGTIRDFCDALLAAKYEAEKEESETKQQLTNENLCLCLQDFFAAGTDTTKFTLEWLLLYIAYYPEHQRKLRQEVMDVIGNDLSVIPNHENRKNLNYIQAFIAEVMRIRPVTPTGGVPHKVIQQVKLGPYILPKGTTVNLHTEAILNSEKYWKGPDQFKPERFIDDKGRFNARIAHFVAFGTGRRACPGERLATADLTLIVARLLQATNGYWLDFIEGNINGDPFITTTYATGVYKVKLRKQ